jgi:hypothetical protein
MTVHARDWLEQQPFGKAADKLWNRGYQFDYISDNLLYPCFVSDGKVLTALSPVQKPKYRVIIVPECEYMPVTTLNLLMGFAQSGATVIFEGHLPKDVPGWSRLELRRKTFSQMLSGARDMAEGKRECRGKILVGDLESCLKSAQVPRETLFDQTGLMCIRRAIDAGGYYFIANRGEKTIDGWVPISTEAKTVVILDPLSGRTGIAASRAGTSGGAEVFLQLAPGESVILRTLTNRKASGVAWVYRDTEGTSAELQGIWQVKFVQGGPELPTPFSAEQLGSWTASGDTNAQRFAGSALYSLTFDAPAGSAKEWQLDLGKVCQSARVRLNGRDLGTLITPPFRVAVDKLKRKGNLLEVEVTNVSANRIRDLDRRGVKWKTFNDINVVNLAYQPFNAANWPLTDSGLLGPVTLTPMKVSAMK